MSHAYTKRSADGGRHTRFRPTVHTRYARKGTQTAMHVGQCMPSLELPLSWDLLATCGHRDQVYAYTTCPQLTSNTAAVVTPHTRLRPASSSTSHCLDARAPTCTASIFPSRLRVQQSAESPACSPRGCAVPSWHHAGSR